MGGGHSKSVGRTSPLMPTHSAGCAVCEFGSFFIKVPKIFFIFKIAYSEMCLYLAFYHRQFIILCSIYKCCVVLHFKYLRII